MSPDAGAKDFFTADHRSCEECRASLEDAVDSGPVAVMGHEHAPRRVLLAQKPRGS